MQKKINILIFILFISFSLIPANFALADCNCYCGSNIGSPDFTDTTSNSDCTTRCNGLTPRSLSMNPDKKCEDNPIVNQGGTTSSGEIRIRDPLGLNGQPEELYARIITALLSFVGIASLIAFVYAGFVFLLSAGNPERVKKAKDTMLYAIIGVAVSMASYAILSFIFETLETATQTAN